MVSQSRYNFTFKRCESQTLFILWSNSTYHTFHKIRRLSVVLRICKSFAIILISPYSVYVVSEILCTVTGNKLQYLLALRLFLNKDTNPSLHITSPAKPGTLHLFPLSAILAVVYLQHLQNFWWFSWCLPRTRAGLWNDGAKWSRLLRHSRCYVLIRLFFSGIF